MQQITVTVKFVISDSKLEIGKNIHHISMDYLESKGTRINKHVDCKQLYNVLVSENSDVFKHGGTTPEGLLAFHGEKINFTRGQAIKKARVFEGKVVKCVD